MANPPASATFPATVNVGTNVIAIKVEVDGTPGFITLAQLKALLAATP
jgi:hypothetical protein